MIDSTDMLIFLLDVLWAASQVLQLLFATANNNKNPVKIVPVVKCLNCPVQPVSVHEVFHIDSEKRKTFMKFICLVSKGCCCFYLFIFLYYSNLLFTL